MREELRPEWRGRNGWFCVGSLTWLFSFLPLTSASAAVTNTT